MLLTIRFVGADPSLPIQILSGEEERHEEFWFGQGLAWAGQSAASGDVHFSLLVDVPRIVARTRRRDREMRFSVGFCDSYAYAASGLMGLFLARFCPKRLGREVVRMESELLAYPELPHSEEIARRIFSPAGYDVRLDGARLQLVGEVRPERVFQEFPALLLALDRRARAFLSQEDLAEIGSRADSWIDLHPARKAIRLALDGRPTPLRFLVSSEIDPDRKKDEEEPSFSLASDRISSNLIPSIAVRGEQKNHAERMFARTDVDRRWLIYLPSAIASLQIGGVGDDLERPEKALSYFRDERVEKAVVEEKHMGSRGVVVLCRSMAVAAERFGVCGELPGCAYTRNGRKFFADEDTE